MHLGRWVGHRLSYVRGKPGQAPMSRAMHKSVSIIVDEAKSFIEGQEQRMLKGFGSTSVKGIVRTKHANVFLNAGTTFIDQKLHNTLELCSIHVFQQGKGFATTLLKELEIVCKHSYRVLLISNVLNPDYAASLRKVAGITEKKRTTGEVSFYLRPAG